MLRERYPNMPALLAAIRTQPGIFLGHRTISGLHLWLSGIRFAEDYQGLLLADQIGGFEFEGFERWIESRHNPRRLSLNSFSLAAQLAGSEASGFDQWYSWYDEFTSFSSGTANEDLLKCSD